jgi:phosphatidylglycerol:prolipoprotein diacylglycerol transferase
MLELGWLKIHWYGFLIAIGIFLCFVIVLHLAKQYGVSKDDIYNMGFYVVIFGLIGDRLYYVFYAWEYYSRHLLDIFKVWEGGLAIHGAMIAGLIVIYAYSKRHKIRFGLLTDLVAVVLPLAMALGRWGNYFNMELFGKPTDLPWGIPISEANRPLGYLDYQYFHPTFLYESLWNLFVFILLFIWHKRRLRKNKNNPEKIQGYGNITLAYLILYSIGRGLNEFLRLDYSPYFIGLRWAQFTSLVIILVCFLIIAYKIFKRIKTNAQPHA